MTNQSFLNCHPRFNDLESFKLHSFYFNAINLPTKFPCWAWIINYEQILIFLLRKLNVSCIIGVHCRKDTIKALTNFAYYYDSTFEDMTVLDRNDDKLHIPDNAPFRIEVEIKK